MFPRKQLVLALLGALVLGAQVAAFSPGSFLAGWLAASLIAFLGLLALLRLAAWSRMEDQPGGRQIALLLAAALLLRLVLGMAISLALPVAGYPEPEQKAGYLFYDAYMRDNQAWDLARSGQPLWKAFGDEFTSDQYGGLLGLSALVYRFLSPDAHRPFLILLLAALAFTLGVPFFYLAARARWGGRVAGVAAWILVLYPDGILFSASQMREPFLIGLLCILFWAVSLATHHSPAPEGPEPKGEENGFSPVSERPQARAQRVSFWALRFLLPLAGLALFSTRIAAAALVVLAVWYFLDTVYAGLSRRARARAWAGFAILAIGLLFVSWKWFASSAAWDFTLLDRVSGQWAKALQGVIQVGKLAALAAYGLARPLLPAAIAATRPPWIWKAIDIFRSAGWWALLPLLAYGGLSAIREKDGANRRTLLWFVIVLVAWLLISSLRGGADQWDNPRYRTIFLPWLALVAGWGIARALQTRDAWLPRLLAVEAVFLTFFTQWYLSRYWTWLHWPRTSIWFYVAGVGLSALAILAGGWLWDRWRAHRVHL